MTLARVLVFCNSLKASSLGARIRGTLGDIDPVNKVPSHKKGPL